MVATSLPCTLVLKSISEKVGNSHRFMQYCRGSYVYDKSGLACVYCVLLFRFIELYRVVYFSLSFGFVCHYISEVIGWEDYTLVTSFVSKTADGRVVYRNDFIVCIPNT